MSRETNILSLLKLFLKNEFQTINLKKVPFFAGSQSGRIKKTACNHSLTYHHIVKINGTGKIKVDLKSKNALG
ncbi:hypothetical protein [Leptospira neocaledonica]|uniref:hypothetical protein n=1 Tax=Leptospira neocaledonica TaxID=2023192 RepID=UPI0013FDDD59|nr:hypothetical protein [Leptospira neocaledonica]